MMLAQPPSIPHSPPQVPAEGVQHPRVPPTLRQRGYFGPPRMELGLK